MRSGRPPKVIRSVQHSIMLPQDLSARMLLLLHSPTAGKIPHGAISDFITALLRDHFRRIDEPDSKL